MAGNSNKGIVVQDRDRRLFEELVVMRVADREQLKCAAGFGSTTRVNGRLLALTRAGLLRRFFLGTVGGARKAIYAASPDSAKLIGAPYRGPRRGRDETLVADFFVTHQLRINDLYCLLKFRPLALTGAGFVRWAGFYESVAAGVSLIPDGYVELSTREKSIAAFLEIDLGHESRTVWKQKVEAYLRYAVSGNFVERFGHQQFRTLVVADSDRRLASLRTATAEVTGKIFWFTTFDAIAQGGFSGPIWQRPVDAEGITLF